MGETAAIVGALATTTGAVSRASAERAMGRYEASVAKANEALALEQAKDAVALGEEEIARRKLEARRLIGAQRAAAAASGVDPSSGSPLELALDAASQAELDAMTIRNNAYRAAYGYRVQAINYRTRARMARIGARQESAQTILSGGLQAANWLSRGTYRWQASGGSGGGGPGYDPEMMADMAFRVRY